MRTQSRRDRRLWLRPNDPINEFSILEDKHGGNTLNLKLACGARILINIQFCDAITSLRFGGQLFHDRANHAAWPTPLGPAVQQNDSLTVNYFLRKRLVSYCQWLVGTGGSNRQRRAALSAFGYAVSLRSRVDAVLSATLFTRDDRHVQDPPISPHADE